MTKQQAKKRIEKLKKVINYHRHLYHVLDRQEIPDAAFDSLKHELFKLEQLFPEFITKDSPTQRVGGKPLEKFEKVNHSLPMLSIEDIFSEEELEDWEDYLRRLEPGAELEYFCELKVDGFAVSLIYRKGIFKTGSTRGNGITGEDVTQNLKTIESIPLRLMSDLQRRSDILEVRGEVYMSKIDFDKFKNQYANPRNLAAGSIRQLDPKLAAERPLKFLAYDIVTDLGQLTHSEEHKDLELLGFKTDRGKICKNLAEVLDFWRDAGKKRENIPFQIDGVVVSINQNSLFQKLGVAGKSPRAIRALKFSPKQATTKILDIKLQVGRTGAITPIAILEPVEVGGVTVSRATLHNEDEIKRLGVKIGDTVIVERAGDVIPAVVKAIKELRTGKEKNFYFPENCPICATKLARPEGEVAWRCPNKNCQAIKRESLYHFISKKAFDIEGLGPKIIDRLLDEKLISWALDLFALKEDDLMPLERFAEKSAKNLIKAIQNSKTISLARFIYALGIRHAGEETAVNLAKYFGSINEIGGADQEELEKVPDIGPEVSKSIYQWFQQKRNKDLVNDLIGAGVEIKSPASSAPLADSAGRQKLRGKVFVLTGILETMTRYRAKEEIRLLGGEVSESVSKKTNYVVAGREAGSKLDKAKKLGINIIREQEFLNFLK